MAIAAHNAHVDVDVLRRKLGDWQCPEVFDTLQVARRLMPGQQSDKLGALVDAFELAEGLPEGLSPHRATYGRLGGCPPVRGAGDPCRRPRKTPRAASRKRRR
jgi:exodeoxyribonuclease X